MSLHLLTALLLAAFIIPSVQAQATFGPPVQTTFSAIGQWFDMAVADYTGDCLPDLVLTDTALNIGHFFIAQNNGTGGFPSVQWQSASIEPFRVLLLDVDGDRWNDVVATSLHGHFVAYRNFGGNLDFQNPMWSQQPGIATIPQLAKADLDLDGDLDLVAGPVTGVTGSPLLLVSYLNTGAGSFVVGGTVTVIHALPYATPAATRNDVQLQDLNGDGLPDLVVLTGQTEDVDVYFNLGAGAFGPRQIIYSGATPVSAMTFADVVLNDGFPDCLLFAGTLVLSAPNPGNGVFGPFSIIISQPANTLEVGAAVDFDADGDADLLHHGTTPFIPMFVRENSNGAFSTAQQIASGANAIQAVDLDLDGYPDLAGYGAGFLRIVRNTTGPTTAIGGGLATSVAGGPFDGSPKSFGPNALVAFGTDVRTRPCLAGRPAALFVNLPPDSTPAGVTSLGASGTFPGLTVVTPFSSPPGTAYLAGDSLGFVAPGFVDLGFGPLAMGDPPITFIAPANLPAGFTIRMQAVYFLPIPAYFSTFGLVATNEVILTAQ